MILTQDQKQAGAENFLNVLGAVRRDFLQASLAAPRIGPYYFGYGAPPKEPVRTAIVGTGNEGSEAMIRQSSPEYLRYVGYCDLRPSHRKRAKDQFAKSYGAAEGAKVKEYASYDELLADKSVEAVVVATPLWTHAPLTIQALKAGKHVLCEKLMARTVADAKEMVRVAEQEKKVLSVGHQRHYSTLYHNVLEVVKSGVLGEIRHIRALWHRNNSWEYRVADLNTDNTAAAALASDRTMPRRGAAGDEWVLNDGWYPAVPAEDRADEPIYRKHGYDSVEQLIRWRLYNKTGGGLMAELGSHQLDACSLFLNKVHPQAVTTFGGHQYYRGRYPSDTREAHDHVYCLFEMPGNVTLLYTSINTNASQGYGEIVYGTKGTLAVLNEREVYLFRESAPAEPSGLERWVSPAKDKDTGKWSLNWGGRGLSADGTLAEAALGRASWFVPAGESAPFSNRGYHEEMEAFADAIRNPGRTVRCDGHVALADAVMALTANVAMSERRHERIEFLPAWYDAQQAGAFPEPKPRTPGSAG